MANDRYKQWFMDTYPKLQQAKQALQLAQVEQELAYIDLKRARTRAENADAAVADSDAAVRNVKRQMEGMTASPAQMQDWLNEAEALHGKQG